MREVTRRMARVSGGLLVVAAMGMFVPMAGASWAGDGDEGMNFGTGVRCPNPPRCGVGASNEAPARTAGKDDRPASRQQPTGSGGGGGSQRVPTIESDGWEYDLGNGVGILPRFDGDEAKPLGRDVEPKPDPAVVAQQVVRELLLPDPVIRTSPDEKHAQLVRVPTWMWLDRAMWRPVSKTAKVPGVSVTATATPRSATWRMGDGETEVCEGSGTPYSPKFAADSSSPDCGHTYVRSSAGQPDDAYTVSVTVTWDVEWRGGGEQGLIPGLQTQAQMPLRVAEAQALVVA
ncbi:hypothetical protein ACFVJK_42830 [Streptomyces sp. NPDC127172]|uniref:hypothetical protein n=1 Tax=Streptomyces sp. NPDC127172 TaxID=3345382 RepID=UPI00362FF46F